MRSGRDTRQRRAALPVRTMDVASASNVQICGKPRALRISAAGAVYLAWGLLLLLLAPPSALASKAMDILKDSIRADGRVIYSATVGIRVRGVGGKFTTHRQKLLQGGQNRRRVEVLSPRQAAGRLIVSDGRSEWEYRPRAKLVQRRELRPLEEVQRVRLSALQLVEDTLHATCLGTGTAAGRKCDIIAVKPPDGRVVRKKIWIDKGKLVELRWQRFTPHGELAAEWGVQTIDFSPHLNPKAFTFKPPRGTKVVKIPCAKSMSLASAEKKIGFRAIVPSYLPPGFAFHEDRVAITRRNGKTALWMRFLNGVDSFSIFQSKALGKPPASSAQFMYWETQGFSCLLTGRIQESQKQKVKESTQR